jgi:hypothetical protein
VLAYIFSAAKFGTGDNILMSAKPLIFFQLRAVENISISSLEVTIPEETTMKYQQDKFM